MHDNQEGIAANLNICNICIIVIVYTSRKFERLKDSYICISKIIIINIKMNNLQTPLTDEQKQKLHEIGKYLSYIISRFETL